MTMFIETLKLNMSISLPKNAGKNQDEALARQKTLRLEHLLQRAKPFLDPVREDPTDMLFYAIGDEDAPYGVRPGRSGHLDSVIKRWLESAIDVGCDCYATQDENGTWCLDGIVTVSYSTYAGQLWLAFYVDDQFLKDKRPLSTLYVCTPTEELG